jgi:hypothetical protein
VATVLTLAVSGGEKATTKRQPNFGVKLTRPGFGPAAELPTSWPA